MESADVECEKKVAIEKEELQRVRDIMDEQERFVLFRVVCKFRYSLVVFSGSFVNVPVKSLKNIFLRWSTLFLIPSNIN